MQGETLDQFDTTTTEAYSDQPMRQRVCGPAPILQLGSRPELTLRPDAQRLLTRYRERAATVAVVGLGYVGLPLSLAACEAGFKVIGYDIDTLTVDSLNGGKSPLPHIADGRIGNIVKAERFSATTDAARFAEADAILICVPTPLGPHHEPDLSFVEATARTIAPHLRRGHMVVLESTTYPGTTT